MKKKEKISRKRILIGIVITFFLVAISVYLYVINNPSCDDRSYDDGWECRYPSYLPFMPLGKDIQYKIKCTKEGGKYKSMVVTDFLYSGSPYKPENGPLFYCMIDYSDYGKSCNSSDECKGGCEYIGEIPSFCTSQDGKLYTCSENIVGTCTRGREDGHNGRRLVDGNTILQTELGIIN